MAKCPKCGAEVSANAKFCEECGEKIPQAEKISNGATLGDKNVVAGDVIGNKIAGDNVQNKVLGNAVFNTFRDDTKIVNECAVCGKHMTNDQGHRCPRCGKIVCEECFNKEKRCCEDCLKEEREKELEIEKAQKAALEAEKAERAKTMFTDPRDGNTYKLVKIGNRTWFAENFRYDCGDGCWNHEDGESKEITKKYGLLYTWHAAVDFCPEGFRLPTEEEWLELFGALVSDSDDSLSLAQKMMTANGWSGKNSSGFNARPSGYISRDIDDDHAELSGYHEQSFFWSSTKKAREGICFDFDGKFIERSCNSLDFGFSVRYIKEDGGKENSEHASKIAVCSCCKKIINSKDKIECPECGKTVCKDCFILEENQCVSCKKKKDAALQKKLEKEKKARVQAETDRRHAELKAKLPENQGYFIDPRDNIVYKVVKIGNQVWFAENFRNENSDFVDSESDSEKYGFLYSQEMASELAPEGWRLPSEKDFKILLSYIKKNGALQEPSGSDIANSLMACGEWNSPATDDFGFSALPAGIGQDGCVNCEGDRTYFCSSKQGLVLELSESSADISNYDSFEYEGFEDWGLSVRYIKEDSSFSKTLEEAQEVARVQAAEIAQQEAEEEMLREEEEAKRINEEVTAQYTGKKLSKAELAKWQETHGFFVDPRDNEVYKVVKIGDQLWLGENYRGECENSYACDVKKYGRLYNQNDAKRLAPKGWHLPSRAEYDALIAYVKINGITDNKEIARSLAKEGAWPRDFGVDSFDFGAMPAGCGSDFREVGEKAFLWCANEDSYNEWYFCLMTGRPYFEYDHYHSYCSVRYIKDDSSFARTIDEATKEATEEAMKHLSQEKWRKNLDIGSRILMVVLAIVLFLVNYSFFSQDFESTGEYIGKGILAYIAIDFVALGLMFAAIRRKKRKEVSDDYNPITLIGGVLIAGLFLAIDVNFVNSPAGDFVFDALEVAFVGAWAYGLAFFKPYK